MREYETAIKLLAKVYRDSETASTEDFGTRFGETRGPRGEEIPVGVSNRHVHLSESDLNALFGQGYRLTETKDLTQPGQYACKEAVTLAGPKGAIEKVRILGPVRRETQIELLAGDCFKLGIKQCVRLSADLDGSPGITVVGPNGSVFKNKGVIVAKRHIHMTPKDAEFFGVRNGQIVGIEVTGERGGVYRETVVRVSDSSALDCHVDTEEANAMGIHPQSTVKLITL